MFDCIAAHDHDEHYIDGLLNSFMQAGAPRDVKAFLHAVAVNELCAQLNDLLAARGDLAMDAELIPGAGLMYQWADVKRVFAARGYSYHTQLMHAGVISEPQGGMVTIDWPTISGMANITGMI